MPGVKLEWAQFGDFDSFDIIRSATSMLEVPDENLPEPIAVNIQKMYYFDNLVTEGSTYFYKIRVWRDGVARVSNEFEITALLRKLYRYYRIYITAVDSDTQVYLGEVELRTMVGGADVTSPSTPTNQSSHIFNQSNPNASKLVDNNTGTWWLTSSGALPAWASFDLISPMDIKQIAILPNASYLYRAPRDFIIQGSNNSVDWENIQSFTGQNWQSDRWNTYDL